MSERRNIPKRSCEYIIVHIVKLVRWWQGQGADGKLQWLRRRTIKGLNRVYCEKLMDDAGSLSQDCSLAFFVLSLTSGIFFASGGK